MKRCVDFLLASFGLVALSPLFAVVAVYILMFDRGSVFFRQLRIGRNGRPFRIWKFRTMVCNAETLGKPLTAGDDPRVTRAGRWLRKTKLDEIPQLINVVNGEMSLVGPRPEVPRYVERYTCEQRRVLTVRPGITDPASIRYRHESELLAGSPDPERLYIEQIMPTKISMNLAYLSRANLLTDLYVVLQTFARILFSRHQHPTAAHGHATHRLSSSGRSIRRSEASCSK